MSRSRSISNENLTESQVIEMGITCRLCSNIVNESYAIPIFDNDSNIGEKIALCLPVIVTPHDKFSKSICETCLDQLDLCSDLIYKSIESEKLFKQQLTDELREQEMAIANRAIVNKNEELNSSTALNPDGPVICDLCGNKKFSNMETFDSHMVSFHDAPQLGHPELVFTEDGEPRYECQACKEHFNSETDLRTHEKTHLELTCKFCHQFYSTLQRLQRHTCPNSDALIGSPKCEIETKQTYENVFPDVDEDSNEAANSQDDSNSDDRLKYECNKCYRLFTNAGNLARHSLIHEEHIVCDVCGKKFHTYSTMLKHRRMHGGNFSSDNCQHCNKVFFKHLELVRHLEQEHNIPRSETSPWACRFCNKRMMTKLSLSIHERIHTGQRPYKCNWCGIGFRSKANLLQHHPVHTGQRKHNCSVCGKGFSRKSFVKTHMRVHTGDRPYACDVCEAKFTQVGDLRRHKKMHERAKLNKTNK